MRGGDGLAVLGRGDAVVATGGDEGGAGDAVEAVPHVVVAAGLELEPRALGGLGPGAHEVDQRLVVGVLGQPGVVEAGVEELRVDAGSAPRARGRRARGAGTTSRRRRRVTCTAARGARPGRGRWRPAPGRPCPPKLIPSTRGRSSRGGRAGRARRRRSRPSSTAPAAPRCGRGRAGRGSPRRSARRTGRAGERSARRWRPSRCSQSSGGPLAEPLVVEVDAVGTDGGHAGDGSGRSRPNMT